MRKILTTINLDQPDLDALAQISTLTGANRSVLIRRAITQFINTQGKQITGALQPLSNANLDTQAQDLLSYQHNSSIGSPINGRLSALHGQTVL